MTDFLLHNWVLILAALTSGAFLLWPHIKGGGGGQSVTPAEAVRLINREKGVLIDISDAATYAAGHAVGARHIPLEALSGTPLPTGLPASKSVPVLLICARGVRSQKAAQILRAAGYERASSVAGGLDAWREAQLPVER